MCLVVVGRATHGSHVDGLRIVGMKSEVDSRHEKRGGSAGRGTSACVHSCGWATDSRHEN